MQLFILSTTKIHELFQKCNIKNFIAILNFRSSDKRQLRHTFTSKIIPGDLFGLKASIKQICVSEYYCFLLPISVSANSPKTIHRDNLSKPVPRKFTDYRISNLLQIIYRSGVLFGVCNTGEPLRFSAFQKHAFFSMRQQ